MKRILSAMLAAMMILTLAGCSNDTESEPREEIDRLQDEIDDLENDREDDTSNTASDIENNTSVSDDINDKDVIPVVETAETVEPEPVCVRLDEAFQYETIDNGIKILGIYMDYRNDSINHIIYPATIDGQPVIEVEYIDWPDQIITVEFEDGYTRIPDYALKSAEGLTKVILPDTVVEIGYAAFAGCEELVTINIPDNIAHIDEDIFVKCEKIEATYLGKTYTYDMVDQLYADINANNAE